MENFVKTLLLFSGAHHESLEGILFGSFFDLLVGDAVSELGSISGALKLLTKIKLGAYENARTCTSGGFDFADPLLAGIFQGITLHQTEADDEAISVCVGNRSESTQVLVTCCVPDLELYLAALVILCTVICIEHSWLVERGEGFLSPSHDDRCLSDGSITNEHKLHIVFLVLVDKGLSLNHSDL